MAGRWPWLAAVAAFMLGLRLVWGSPLPALATGWVPDDAYYYLQPAWMAAHGWGFTFDGLQPSYGFQPLWETLLVALAWLSPDKAVFLRLALSLGVALHLLAGGLLQRWLGRMGHPLAGALAATLWWLNPDLLRMMASGMESGLRAVLLLLLLILLGERPMAWPRWVLAGALGGLVFLCRTSDGVLLALLALLANWGLLQRGTSRGPRRMAGLWVAMASGALVVAPWLLYARLTFGQALPASVGRRLVGGWAGLAHFVQLPAAWAHTLLPSGEALLFPAPALVRPTLAGLWRYGPQASAGWALGFWLPAEMGPRAVVAGLGLLLVVGALLWRVHRVRWPWPGAHAPGECQNALRDCQSDDKQKNGAQEPVRWIDLDAEKNPGECDERLE